MTVKNNAKIRVNLKYIANCIETGADVIFVSGDYAMTHGPMVSREHTARFLTPMLKKIVDLAHAKNKPIIKHSDGNIWQIIDYKTNDIKSNQANTTAKKYLLQMDVYALLLSGVFPDQKEYPVNLYFTKPDEIYKKIYSPDEIKDIKIRVKKIINELKEKYF